MKINHFIIGSANIKDSISFYKDLFGFEETNDDPGSDEGMVMEGRGCDLLLLRLNQSKLPNPAHFAFETNDSDEFELILKKARSMNLEPRSAPALNSKKEPGQFSRSGFKYRNFYISDPSGSNVELMLRL